MNNNTDHAAHAPAHTEPEWFARPDSPEAGAGLRFSCTCCGNCCSGPAGFVLVTDQECADIAATLNITTDHFINTYTHILPEGRSLIERKGPRGYDCVFLDRTTQPGKAICGVYSSRPAQCRTWPFWSSIIKSRDTWTRASLTCPGINKGELVPLQQIRIRRDTINM